MWRAAASQVHDCDYYQLMLQEYGILCALPKWLWAIAVRDGIFNCHYYTSRLWIVSVAFSSLYAATVLLCRQQQFPDKRICGYAVSRVIFSSLCSADWLITQQVVCAGKCISMGKSFMFHLISVSVYNVYISSTNNNTYKYCKTECFDWETRGWGWWACSGTRAGVGIGMMCAGEAATEQDVVHWLELQWFLFQHLSKVERAHFKGI